MTAGNAPVPDMPKVADGIRVGKLAGGTLNIEAWVDGDSTTIPLIDPTIVPVVGNSGSIEKLAKSLPDLNTYQDLAHNTAQYPDSYRAVDSGNWAAIMYPVVKLNGEAGEVAELVGKQYRRKGNPKELRDQVKLELGDVLWYVAEIATAFGIPLEEVAKANLAKLYERTASGTIADHA